MYTCAVLPLRLDCDVQVHGWINAVTWGIIFPIVILLAHSLRSVSLCAYPSWLLLHAIIVHCPESLECSLPSQYDLPCNKLHAVSAVPLPQARHFTFFVSRHMLRHGGRVVLGFVARFVGSTWSHWPHMQIYNLLAGCSLLMTWTVSYLPADVLEQYILFLV